VSVSSFNALRALAIIRLVNGGVGLLAPNILVRRLGAPDGSETVAYYPFRMFGIRTVLLGWDLLILRGPNLERAVKMAVVIHASDTVSAATGGLRHEVPRKTAVMTTAISALNTGFALAALYRRPWLEEEHPRSTRFARRSR
jgi:hypothetical protein